MSTAAPTDEPQSPGPTSERVRVRRGAARASYDTELVHSILDEAMVAHVGVSAPDGPVVLPMAYGRVGSTLYLHGANANALLGRASGAQLCVTVTLLDGLVFARCSFHNSMNYRCVVVRGRGRAVSELDERIEALRAISDHVVANWEHTRAVTDGELRRTSVLALELAECSAKVRSGDPVDEPEDLDGPHWAGTVALASTAGPPVPSADLAPGIAAPPSIAARFGR